MNDTIVWMVLCFIAYWWGYFDRKSDEKVDRHNALLEVMEELE